MVAAGCVSVPFFHRKDKTEKKKLVPLYRLVSMNV